MFYLANYLRNQITANIPILIGIFAIPIVRTHLTGVV